MKQNKQQIQLQKGICRWVEMGWSCMVCQSSLPLCETELSPSQQLFLRHTCLSCPRKDTSKKHACVYVFIQACTFFSAIFFLEILGSLNFGNGVCCSIAQLVSTA